MRLIDADEAIRRAKEPSIYDLVDTPEFLSYCPTVNLAGKWISVKNRLPEDQNDVLIYFDRNGGEYGLGWYSSHGLVGPHWVSGGAMLPNNVTHWMPLPTPPTKEEHI